MSEKERWSISPKLVDPSGGQRNADPTFPGFDELPFRGEPMDRKEDDPEHLQPQRGARAHVEILEMDNPDDIKRMEDIYSMLATGTAIVSAEDRQWIPDKQTWRVFIRWADLYTYNPRATMRGGR